MATDGPKYPILVDTDALFAVANSPLWELIPEQIGVTATNVYQHELTHHCDTNRASAPEGSRPYRLHRGSARVLEALELDERPLTSVVRVRRPHGADDGEQSLN